MKSELKISLLGSSKPSSGFFPLEAFGTENKHETYNVTLTPPDKVNNARQRLVVKNTPRMMTKGDRVRATTDLGFNHRLSIPQQSFSLLQFSSQFPLGLSVASFVMIAQFLESSVDFPFGLRGRKTKSTDDVRQYYQVIRKSQNYRNNNNNKKVLINQNKSRMDKFGGKD